jgi:hypothetical protein
MYAYVMASMTFNLKHEVLADQMYAHCVRALVVTAAHRAHVPDHLALLPPEADAPLALHFCQKYNMTTTDTTWSMVFSKHDWHQQTLLKCNVTGERTHQRSLVTRRNS